LAEAHAGGDPMNPRRKWVRRSLRNLAADLLQQGHRACPHTVGRMLRPLGFGLRGNLKRLSGPPHPDREAPFQHIAGQRQVFTAAGQPILSIDAKKKELVGNFKNAGTAWCQRPESVNTYDFIADAQCRATPYGLYDPVTHHGHVCVGTSADTAVFATDALANWWQGPGKRAYPQARQVLLLADGGGSNGYRVRLWKCSLQRWADRTGLAVTVCHYPRGASKWNPIEHRLFSQISRNWAAVPLRTLDTMLACLRGTKTQTGLRVTASHLERTYPTRQKVSNQEMQQLNLQRHTICPKWNYTIRPHTSTLNPSNLRS
jgi:hypothetical protein